MTRNLLVAFCLSLGNMAVYSQGLGINNSGAPPNSSAGLDVDFNNKGILITRVALSSLTDAVTIPSPATSLLVYSSGGSVTDGYYYNSGTPASPVWASFITTASANSGCFANWQLFTANGSFIVPAGVTKIKVLVYGGGAGGGCGNIPGGGGGGAGGYAEGIYTVVSLSSYAVVIGTGGTGGLSGLPGTNGGASSFGALISASGGLGGTVASYGGAGGMGSGGYLNTSLGSGGTGSTDVLSGNGTGGGGTGANIWPGGYGGGAGGGGPGGGNGGAGAAAGYNALPNTGAGGGGGGGVGGGGGNGASGKVLVFW